MEEETSQYSGFGFGFGEKPKARPGGYGYGRNHATQNISHQQSPIYTPNHKGSPMQEEAIPYQPNQNVKAFNQEPEPTKPPQSQGPSDKFSELTSEINRLQNLLDNDYNMSRILKVQNRRALNKLRAERNRLNK